MARRVPFRFPALRTCRPRAPQISPSAVADEITRSRRMAALMGPFTIKSMTCRTSAIFLGRFAGDRSRGVVARRGHVWVRLHRSFRRFSLHTNFIAALNVLARSDTGVGVCKSPNLSHLRSK